MTQVVRALVLVCFAFAAACGSPPPPDELPDLGETSQPVWDNGDFEQDAIGTMPPTGWTLSTNLHQGLTDLRPNPQTLASLNLAAGGTPMTTVVGGAAETQIDPDVGAAGTLRYPKYGSRAVRVNYLNSGSNGTGRNSNTLTQTMTVSAGDVDPIDDKVHVRFAIAPILQNPGHGYTEQPYYFVRLFNITKGITVYQDFNASGQPGVPWKDFIDLSGQAAQYTDWQLVDVSPGNSQLAIGDSVELLVVASGCSQSGHWGRVYLDSVGSGVPGLYTWATGAQQANAGTNLVYTINYKNGGTTTTNNTTVEFVTPPDTTYQANSLGCTAPAVGATGTVSCAIGSVSPGGTSSFTVTVAIPGATPNGTVITNGNYSIFATGASALLGPKVQTTVTNGVQYADLAITKTDGVAARIWGQATQYTIVASNSGPLASSGTITDTMPANLTGVTWTCAAAGGATCTASGAGNINQSVSLPVGGSVTYTVNGSIVSGSGNGTITNTATIATDGGLTDPDSTDNTAVDTDSIGTLHQLDVTKLLNAAAGTVTSVPSTINCGAVCSGDFLQGNQVVLTATPANGATFSGWGGACSGSASTCTLTIAAATSVTAAFVGAPASMTVSGGGTQTATISTAFAQPLAVTVLDSLGNPVPGVSVAYAAPGSGARATLSSPTATTNASGVASVTATANATAGAYSVTATVSGVAPVSFALNNVGLPASIAVSAGNSQSTQVLTGFATNLAVVVLDAASQPVPGATVTFARPGSGASITGAATAVTNASGIASIAATATATAGSFTVNASVTGVGTPAAFSLTNTAGPATTLAVFSGDAQTTTVNTAFAAPLVALLTDANGNPVAGGTVAFTAPGSGSSASSFGTPSATTAANGRATTTVTANTFAGTYSVTATASGIAPVTFAMAQTAGAVASMFAVGGGGQSTTVNTAFPIALEIVALDAFGNPKSGASVTFSVPGTGASAALGTASVTTNSSGRASSSVTANTVAGSYTAAAQLTGVASVSFPLTNLPGAPAAVSVSAGSPQSAVVTTAFATALRAQVVDGFGNAVPGVSVAFTAPASGASATFSAALASTDALGRASVTATANTVAGSFSATASTAGATSASFSLTNTFGAAASISVVSGSGQTTTVLTAYAAPLVVAVADAHGNPVSGASVAFTAPGTGASATPSAPTATTAANGRASVTAIANAIVGSFSVTATIPAGSVQLALSSTAGAPASIQVSSGSGQSTVVGAAFAQPLVAIVRDASSNVVPGATVSFGAPPTGATATFASPTATTGSDGRASIGATAGTVAGGYTLTATVTGVATPATFTATNTHGAAATLAVVSGDEQTTVVNTAFAAPLVVAVTDAHGNPVAGSTVAFAAPASGASATLATPSPVTAANGRASTVVTAKTIAGSYAVTATVTGIAPVSFSLAQTAGTAASMTAVAGGGQNTVVNTAFATALRILAVDAFGNPAPGATVTFSVPGTGASATLGTVTATTDATGHATSTVTANTIAGSYSAGAQITGTTPVSFALTNRPGAAATVSVSAGSPQSAVVTTAFATPLRAQVVDAFGNAVPGVSVAFAGPASGARASFAPASSPTDALGRASSVATAGTIAGSYSATATVTGLPPATFALTNTFGAAVAISVVSGAGQTTTVLTPYLAPIVVAVADAHGNPVSGATVTFAGPSTGPSATPSQPTVATAANGQASVTATATSIAGSFAMTASIPASAISIALTSTAADAATIEIAGGDAQTPVVATAFAEPLAVIVRDESGNVVADATVAFSASVGGATASFAATTATTDANGVATMTATASQIAGGYAITASLDDLDSVDLHATNLADVPASITVAEASSPQATIVEATFSEPLAVHVADQFGNAAPGATVQLTAPIGGATATLGAPSFVTDAQGEGAVVATASAIAGSYVVFAAVAGVTNPGAFSLTNLAASPANLSVSGGDEQAAVVNVDFAAALEVLVVDGHGNPVPNAVVGFSAPEAGPTAVLAQGTAATDATGKASISARAGTITGSYEVVATVNGGSSPVTFALTNLPGTPTAIAAAVTSTPQSATVSTPYAQPLAARVTDPYGNAVPGTTVTYAAPAAGATGSLSSATATTDAQGWASVDLTATTVAGAFQVTAAIPGATATFALQNLSGPVSTLSVFGGDAQHAVVDTVFGAPLVVQVRDGFGNAVPGAVIAFAVPATGATAVVTSASVTTGADGRASTAVRAGTVTGAYQVVATTPLGAAPIVFALDNRPDVAASVTVDEGATPQSAEVGHAFATPLGVSVADRFGNKVPGVVVTFHAPAAVVTASLSAATVSTSADGHAEVIAIANAKIGSYAVTATVAGVTAPATLNLTNTSAAPGSVAVMSGGGQRAMATTAFAQPIVIRVIDGFGNKVPGAAVTVSIPAGGPTVVGTVPVSDSDGVVSFAVLAGAVVGDFTASVQATGTVGATSVMLTVEAIPTAITATAGDVTVDEPVVAHVVVTGMIGTPTGTVEILDETGAVVGSAMLAAGQADVSVTVHAVGAHSFTARYQAQGSYGAATSASFAVEASEDAGSLSGGSSCSTGGNGTGWLAMLLAVGLVLRRRRAAKAGAGLAVAVVAVMWPAAAQAQSVGARSIERMHAASPDSSWFSLDSLTFGGHREVAVEVVGDYARRPLVAYDANGDERGAIVRNALVLHLGGSVTIRDRFRLSAVAPMAVFQDGESIPYNGMPLTQPTTAFGDVAVSADARVLGAAHDALRAAVGVRVSLPTGSRTNYMSNGVFAVEPRAMIAGSPGRFEYAASASVFLREETGFAGMEFGHELRYSAAAGVRFADDKVLVGPELVGAVALTGDSGAGQPTEIGLGAHFQVSPMLQVGLGASAGVVNAVGSPDQRVLLSISWLP